MLLVNGDATITIEVTLHPKTPLGCLQGHWLSEVSAVEVLKIFLGINGLVGQSSNAHVEHFLNRYLFVVSIAEDADNPAAHLQMSFDQAREALSAYVGRVNGKGSARHYVRECLVIRVEGIDVHDWQRTDATEEAYN